jgi:hypothetical protein
MRKSKHVPVLVSALIAAAAIIASALVLKHWITAPGLRGFVAALPIPFYAAFLVERDAHCDGRESTADCVE